MIIAIDFDGTIVDSVITNEESVGWEMVIVNEKLEAIKTIKLLKGKGHELIIWTCRSGVHYDQMIEWLKEKGIYDCFSKFNEHSDIILLDERYTNPRKIHADVYIDDRNLLGFPGWQMVLKELM